MTTVDPYLRPSSLASVMAALGQGQRRIIAGATDYYPALRDGPVIEALLDLTAVDELKHVGLVDDHWVIGATATWQDVQKATLPYSFKALVQAAAEVGSPQIQNRASIMGNLCNASPAADGVPPLLVLDAKIEILSPHGSRIVPLSEFILGNRKTALARNELAARILVPVSSAKGTSAFLKLGARKYLVISIAMVAVRIEVIRGQIAAAAVAVGACSETAQRLPKVEQALQGLSMNDIPSLEISPAMLATLKPLDDVRAPAAYRLQAVGELIKRATLQALA
jgi:CO/xanthine dehydrogenase FAD-binding subunit